MISLAYINSISLLEPWQSNLSKSEINSEPCKTSKMECFVKIVSGLKLLTFFAKDSILDVYGKVLNTYLLLTA